MQITPRPQSSPAGSKPPADGRPVNEFEEVIERVPDRLPRVGLWVDPSRLNPKGAVDLLLDRQAEAVWMVNAADLIPRNPDQVRDARRGAH
jgi:hypothetical protein